MQKRLKADRRPDAYRLSQGGPPSGRLPAVSRAELSQIRYHCRRPQPARSAPGGSGASCCRAPAIIGTDIPPRGGGGWHSVRVRHRLVPLSIRDLPTLPLRMHAANPELVVDGDGPLLVGRIAGVERTAKGNGRDGRGLGSPVSRRSAHGHQWCPTKAHDGSRLCVSDSGSTRARIGSAAGSPSLSRPSPACA